MQTKTTKPETSACAEPSPEGNAPAARKAFVAPTLERHAALTVLTAGSLTLT